MFKNTLLIDDDLNTLYLHRHFLNHYDFFENLLEFQDANQALQTLVQDETEDTSLILLDLNMPVMSGWEFVDKLSISLTPKQLNKTTIVIVSSSNNTRDIKRAENHPHVYTFVEKPFLPDDIEQMLTKLKLLMQNGTELQQAI